MWTTPSCSCRMASPGQCLCNHDAFAWWNRRAKMATCNYTMNTGRWRAPSERIRTASEIPIEVDLTDEDAVPSYMKISEKVVTSPQVRNDLCRHRQAPWGQLVDGEKGSSLGENPSHGQLADLPPWHMVRHICSPAQQSGSNLACSLPCRHEWNRRRPYYESMNRNFTAPGGLSGPPSTLSFINISTASPGNTNTGSSGPSVLCVGSSRRPRAGKVENAILRLPRLIEYLPDLFH